MHRVIRQALRTLAGERGMAIPILYGGSVNRGNAAALLTAPEVDGVLVGGASLDADAWASIVRSEPTRPVPAVAPSSSGQEALDDAPGSYVLEP